MSRPLAARRVAKVRRLIKAKAKAGKLYRRVHALTAELLAIAPAGTEIEVDGKTYAVRDNFAGKVAFKNVAIDRWDVKEKTDGKPKR